MTLANRYGLLTVFVIIYQILFFIPLQSAPAVDSIDINNSLTDLIYGVSPYVYHYQSLGLLPFVFGTLIISVVGIAYAPWRNLDKMGSLGATKKKKLSGYFTYAFGFAMSLGVAANTGYLYFELSFWLVVLELMFALQTLKFIFDQVQKLNVASSGVSVFFGLNILSLFVRDFSLLLKIEYTAQAATMLLGVIYLSAMTVYITYKFIFGCLVKEVLLNKATQGSSVRAPLLFQYTQTGILPVIFAMMLTSVVSTYFFPDGGAVNPAFTNVFTFTFFILVLFAVAFYFTNEKISPNEILRKLAVHGAVISGEKPSRSIGHTLVELKKVRNKIVFIQVGFLLFMLVAQHQWALWSQSEEFPTVGYVAGINWFLLLTVYADMSKQYDKLKLSS
tara:strand:+ start:26081 stop:27250 length:1170 start_codon:yes stop_codon:yes gene_type:complete